MADWENRYPQRESVAAGPSGWEGEFVLRDRYEDEETHTEGEILRGVLAASGELCTPQIAPHFLDAAPGIQLKIEKSEERLGATCYTMTTRYRVRLTREALPVRLLVQQTAARVEPAEGIDESSTQRYSLLVEAPRA
jgi:hypothetical protein